VTVTVTEHVHCTVTVTLTEHVHCTVTVTVTQHVHCALATELSSISIDFIRLKKCALCKMVLSKGQWLPIHLTMHRRMIGQ
jgi:hypothetical protein